MANHIVYLRASPAVGVGGMYAVNNGNNEVVTIGPQIPPLIDRQKWDILPVDGDAGTVMIRPSADVAIGAWGLLGEAPNPEAPLVVVDDQARQIVWALQPIDNGVANAYTLLMIRPTIIGAAWYAGTNEQNEVVFRILPLGVPDEDKPYWVLYNVDD